MRMSVPGRHMALNALGALLAAMEVGRLAESVLDGLAGFEGVRRRFELVGTAHGVRVFDDYAHHPTEVRATLGAVRTVTEQSGRGRSVVVFQPHLYSRTAAFAREFGQALDSADEVFVLDVYAAREQPMAGISGATVAEHVGKPVHYVPDFSAVAELVANAVRSGDVVVTMGAGDVTMLGPEIVAALAAGPTAPRRRADPKRARDDRAGGRQRGDGRDRDERRAPRRRPSRDDGETESEAHREEEFEGPRRRARREREARREAQARAVAIEQARREAKRRAQGKSADESKTPARGAVRGLKVVVWTVAARRLVRRPRPAAVLHPDHGGAQRRHHRSRRGDAGRGHRRGRRQAGHAAAAGRTPTTSPSGWPRSAASPAHGCSANTRRRFGSRSSNGCRSSSRTIPTARTCSTATAWTSRPRRRRPTCRTWRPTTPVRAIRRRRRRSR